LFAPLYKHACDITVAKVMSTVGSRQTVAANVETGLLGYRLTGLQAYWVSQY